jgi:hypothetical protein
MRFFVTN